MKGRKFHRFCAITFSPFFLFAACSGGFLLFRKAKLYDKEIKELIVSLHTWEIIAPYIGMILALGLLSVTISGIILFFNRRAGEKLPEDERRGYSSGKAFLQSANGRLNCGLRGG